MIVYGLWLIGIVLLLIDSGFIVIPIGGVINDCDPYEDRFAAFLGLMVLIGLNLITIGFLRKWDIF
jgi:hypothetical protein